MAMLTTANVYDDVRAALDSSLSPTDLPDVVIGRAPYLPAAVREVAARDPLYGGRTDPNQEAALQLAVMLFAASYLAPHLPVVVSEADDTGYKVQRQPVDLLALAASLRGRAEAALAVVLDVADVTPYRPTLFSLASGRRGA